MNTKERQAIGEASMVGHGSLKHAPMDKPPFTLSQIKKAIPPHCFKRSVLRSSSYLFHDLAVVAILLYIAVNWIPSLPSPYHRLVAWVVYWVCQGCIFTGVWVIAHECGHHAFSNSSLLDDLVGLVLHSALLFPYFSWKYSHRRHHSNTGSLERDEVYVPLFKSSLPWYSKYLNNPLGRFLVLCIYLTMGLFVYVAFNAAGRAYPRFACHFDPYSPIYSKDERVQVIISDAGILTMSYILYCLCVQYSLGWVVQIYGIPLLIVNAFVVIITYLHHTHRALPHYDDSEWDWLRGSLATMDRDYGILSKVFHNITDTHVAHHLFPSIPHYHAMEATKAIEPVLGEYYQFDDTPVLIAMWRELNECIYVEADEGDYKAQKGVFWYSN